MPILSKHFGLQNISKNDQNQSNIQSQLTYLQKNEKNIKTSSCDLLQHDYKEFTKLNKKIHNLTNQNHKLKEKCIKIVCETKEKFLNLEECMIKKQLKLNECLQKINKDLSSKEQLNSSLKEKNQILAQQNQHLKEKLQQILKQFPQIIMEFFNKQNSNILLSQKNIKKWFKVLQQNLIQKMRFDLNQKLQKQQRLTFASSQNVESKSKNSIPQTQQNNSLKKRNHWKSFFNSQLSGISESKHLQQNNEKDDLQNMESSFALTQSRQGGSFEPNNQLFFQKTIHFKFQGNKKKLNTQQKDFSNKKHKTLKLQNQKQISITDQNKMRFSCKSNQNLFIKTKKITQNSNEASQNQQNHLNKKTNKKLGIHKNQNFWNNNQTEEKSEKIIQKLNFSQQEEKQRQIQFLFKNQLLKQYNKVLESRHQKCKKNHFSASNSFSQIKVKLNTKKINYQ